ncbi:MAG: aminotransferase class IV [Solobacterium sp.]|nr:aminotransferase class IV [Solobacterium sp.]
MQEIGFYNGRIGPLNEMEIPMQDRALFFGDGVYDFAIAYNKKIFTPEDHIDRFYNSMRLLEIEPYCDRETLKKYLQECVDMADTDDGVAVYWQTSRGNCRRNHVFPDASVPSTLLITVTAFKTPDFTKPLKLITMEDTRFFHCNIKTLNLIPNVMAAERAKEAGCTEAVLHRGDSVTECAHSAVLLLKNGTLIAPPLDELILPSVTRKHIIEICEDMDIPVDIRRISLEEVFDADEVIVVSTSKLMCEADTVDGRPVGMKDRELFEKIRQTYFDRLYKETGYRI